MISKDEIITEYVSEHINICGSVIREDKDENWYEIELENECSRSIFSIKAQLRFYDEGGAFIGFEEDTHDAYLEPYRKVALAIYAIPPAGTHEIRLTIDATADDEDADKKDTLWALGILTVLTAAAGIFAYFYRN